MGLTKAECSLLGESFGALPRGARNLITDVPGVRVTNVTLDQDDLCTGLTLILPGEDNLFVHKRIAASFVHNGFGKTLGLVQVDELGSLETPIALTNTLNVGLVHDALVSYTLERCQREGVSCRSLNPVVGECNDSRLSAIEKRPVQASHVWAALHQALEDGLSFDEGDAGAGKGTICYGFKGGIGSSSRLLEIEGVTYTLGVLVQSNFGAMQDFVLGGRCLGQEMLSRLASEEGKAQLDQGSIMLILATDLPLTSRQLRRLIRRMGAGLARSGSYIGHGSGEIMIGFTNANVLDPEAPLQRAAFLREDLLNLPFRAAADCAHEAVISSMFHAKSCLDPSGSLIPSLHDLFE